MNDEMTINLTVNGEQRAVTLPVRATLADAVRTLGLTGTHLGCEEGVCGSCTVIVDGEPVRSCLMLAPQADGRSVRTIEGVATAGGLHPLQRAFHEHGALQCGFCTPGFVLLAQALLEREPDASPERIREALSDNLCRCTGYAPIIDAVLDAQREMAQ